MAQHTSDHPNTVQRVRAINLGFSLYWWSVFPALALAVAVAAGILPSIPW